jgi:hypothetical protein
VCTPTQARELSDEDVTTALDYVQKLQGRFNRLSEQLDEFADEYIS